MKINPENLLFCIRRKLLINTMRALVFLCFSTVFGLTSSNVISQNSKIKIDANKTLSVDEVFDLIMEQTDYKFIYQEGIFDDYPKVDLKKGKIPTNELLERSLSKGNFKITVTEDNAILVKENFQELALKVNQGFQVSGTLTDVNGSPLPGANILEKGTSNGAQTDFDGNFSLSVANENAVLVISYVGFATKEISVNGQSKITISMMEDASALDEVVVVGYGTQKKSDIIGSVSSVDAEEVMKIPSSDLGEMLRGKAAGVYITQGDAGPGSNSNILIRGRSSINGGNSPVVIVDGVPVGGINDVNPNDIASIEILKDAAAQAIYGARASNGVILITTKRAEGGKTKVDVNAFFGMQTINDSNFDLYSGPELAQLVREGYRTENNGNYLPDADIFGPIEQEVLQTGEFVDWRDEVLQVAPIQNYNLSLSSGSENTKVFSSFNFINQEGVVPGTDYQRATIRLNADQTITDWLKFGANANIQFSDKNDPGTGGTLNRLITASPLGKVFNDDGTFRFNPTGFQESINPLLDINETTNLEKNHNILLNFFADVKLFEGLNYRFNVSRRYSNDKNTSYSTGNSISGIRAGNLGSGNIFFQDFTEWQFENIFTYNKEINDHNLGVTFVQSAIDSKYNQFNNGAGNIPNDILGIYGLESAEFNTPSIGGNERSLTSYVARIQYDYFSKYYLTLSARADGSSVFGRNNKWGYFPAAAIGWNMHKESFMKDLDYLNNLKLRVSYGSVGNEGIQPYQSLSNANQRDYIFNGVKRTGFVPGSFLSNPDLKWETSTTFNSAIDFGLWKNRFSGTLEFYNTRTKDLLVDQALNAGLGYTRRKTNIGEVENQGIELALNAVVVDKKDLRINAGIVFSSNKNKIISLYGLDEDGDGIEDDDVANRWFIGQPIDVNYDFKPIGIYQEGDDIANSNLPNANPGNIKLFDRDPSDGELNADDRVVTKQDPKWFGTFNFDMKYKNLDFSFVILSIQGVKRNNPYLYDYNLGGSLRGVFNGIKVDYWTPEEHHWKLAKT